MRKLLAAAVAICAAATLTACAGQGASGAANTSGLPSLALRIPVTGPTAATLPLYVAKEKGFYAEQGLDASFVTVASGAAMMPAVTSGQVDVASSALPTILGIRQGGEDLQVITGWTAGYNYSVFVRKGANIPPAASFEDKMKALSGKTIGAQGGAGGVVVPFLKAMIGLGGGDSSNLNIPNVAYGGPQIAALQSGQVDAVLADDSTVSTANKLGLGSSYFSLLNDPPAQYKDLLISGIAVKASMLAQHPDFAERFLKATDKTAAWIKDPANADDLKRIATKVQGLPDAPDLGTRLTVLAGTLQPRVGRAELEKSLAFLYDSKQVKPEPRVALDQFFNPVMITQ